MQKHNITHKLWSLKRPIDPPNLTNKRTSDFDHLVALVVMFVIQPGHRTNEEKLTCKNKKEGAVSVEHITKREVSNLVGS